MLSYFGGAVGLVLDIIGLLSGVLSVVRAVQLMYWPPKSGEKQVFWNYVLIAFVIAAALSWYNAFNSLKAREAELLVANRGLSAAQNEMISLKSRLADTTTQLEANKAALQRPASVIVRTPNTALKQDILDLLIGVQNWAHLNRNPADPTSNLFSDEQLLEFHHEFNARIESRADQLLGRGLQEQSTSLRRTLKGNPFWPPLLIMTLKESAGLL